MALLKRMEEDRINTSLCNFTRERFKTEADGNDATLKATMKPKKAGWPKN